ncbi:MFS transporter [Microbacterium hominis]|uniref:MFS transporter n=1 Tax=Microbacterium TaxID=33882 RepID=UPI00168BDFA8|nr:MULTISPECIES: MFS transporter [Microbacterium]QOC26884.1 MFS transporter [Microbacterium hominis]QOC28051.1 MFS transporter [Microbacterium hominis]QYF96783.1 MFS transporter [Microbacterium sp. PAMC21962]
MSKTRSERPGLLKNANYRRLLGASAFGAVSAGAAGIGLDLVAVITLQASAFEVGLINAVGTVSYLVLSVPVGVLVDRMRKSAIMGFAELLAAVALLWIPVAFMLGILEYWQLLLVTFVSGFAGMLFSIASRSVLPDIVDDDNVALAYSRQESATTAIDIVAPFVVGQVLRWVAAPFVLLISSVARVLSSHSGFQTARVAGACR